MVAAVAALAFLAGCGSDDEPGPPPPALRPATTTAAVPTPPGADGLPATSTSTTTVPTTTRPVPPATTRTAPSTTTRATTATTPAVAAPPIASTVDPKRRLRFEIRTIVRPPAGRTPGPYLTVSVTRATPRSVRRRLARTSGYALACTIGSVRQQSIVGATGSTSALSPGTRIRATQPLTGIPAGQNGVLAIRTCTLSVSSDPRGSPTRTFLSRTPYAAAAFS